MTRTADTVTDVEIRALLLEHPVLVTIATAAPDGSVERHKARARCAEILNARAKEAK